MRSANDLRRLSNQVLPSIKVFIPDDAGIFQEDNASISQAQIVKELLRDDGTSFSHMDGPLQPQWEPLGCAGEALLSGPFLPSSIQNLGKKLMQQWMEKKSVKL